MSPAWKEVVLCWREFVSAMRRWRAVRHLQAFDRLWPNELPSDRAVSLFTVALVKAVLTASEDFDKTVVQPRRERLK